MESTRGREVPAISEWDKPQPEELARRRRKNVKNRPHGVKSFILEDKIGQAEDQNFILSP